MTTHSVIGAMRRARSRKGLTATQPSVAGVGSVGISAGNKFQED
ncbi:MAG TPA: hypothetical protein VHJ18_11420 [Streptosporangiaceae bacterium]|nr:hypothetical protein [Streptosporangiaceae bacterium]